MAFIEISYIAFFVDVRIVRDDPYFIEGVDRDIGRSKFFL